MNNNREQLIPSADLSEFYTMKIATCLTVIYNYKDELNENKILILKINKELEEIFKQIKYRLIRHEYKTLVEKYQKQNNELNKLKPFVVGYGQDDEGERVKKQKITKDYYKFKSIVIEKECIIWEALDVLGLLGKVEKKGRRLR